ncbi:MAG: hypothetical protein ABIF85_02250 [Nanoarchaeota archaeon]|nr:hypothetical protein [Nanoarchaeota archaeon]MBU4300407.1 hypothetical protein [Nanoarchaeota archaeon]MBU4451359.1 hypothetical protein [Nanoarchaeota archaeon]MCG2723762.1 hypothetical protein [archaeon]
MARYRCSACMAEIDATSAPKVCALCNAKSTLKKVNPETDSHCAGCTGCCGH